MGRPQAAGQDMLLLGPPGSLRRQLALRFCCLVIVYRWMWYDVGWASKPSGKPKLWCFVARFFARIICSRWWLDLSSWCLVRWLMEILTDILACGKASCFMLVFWFEKLWHSTHLRPQHIFLTVFPTRQYILAERFRTSMDMFQLNFIWQHQSLQYHACLWSMFVKLVSFQKILFSSCYFVEVLSQEDN